MDIITLGITFAIMILIMGGLLWWWFYCKSPSKWNGLLWVHPDKGGGIIGIKKEPTGQQKPFFYNYRALELGLYFFRKPLYMWAQDKVTDSKGIVSYPIVHWEPTEAADFMLQATAQGEPDKTKPYVTPNQLFATTDWRPLRILETATNSIKEAIKLGMAIIMVCVCIFGIIVALDMIGKKDTVPTAPIQTGKPLNMIIQPINYGGLGIW